MKSKWKHLWWSKTIDHMNSNRSSSVWFDIYILYRCIHFWNRLHLFLTTDILCCASHEQIIEDWSDVFKFQRKYRSVLIHCLASESLCQKWVFPFIGIENKFGQWIWFSMVVLTLNILWKDWSCIIGVAKSTYFKEICALFHQIHPFNINHLNGVCDLIMSFRISSKSINVLTQRGLPIA